MSTVACGNGPATASTPDFRAASVSWASVTLPRSNAATTCGPCCLPKARSNGADAASTSPSATTIDPVDTRVTIQITSGCSLRLRTAARAAFHTALMPTAPACAHR